MICFPAEAAIYKMWFSSEEKKWDPKLKQTVSVITEAHKVAAAQKQWLSEA